MQSSAAARIIAAPSAAIKLQSYKTRPSPTFSGSTSLTIKRRSSRLELGWSDRRIRATLYNAARRMLVFATDYAENSYLDSSGRDVCLWVGSTSFDLLSDAEITRVKEFILRGEAAP